MLLEHEIHTEAARDRAARLNGDWAPIAPRLRVRLTLGRWLIGAGRRLAPEFRPELSPRA
jgi:hypothetical protein